LKETLGILFINSIGRRKYGGGEKWMITAAKGLLQRGHRVFLASKSRSEVLHRARLAGIPVKIFNIGGDFSPLNTWRIARFLQKERIDVLVCNLNKDVRVAGLAARLISRPVAVIARHGIVLCGKKWRHKWTLTHLVDGILTNSRSIRATYATYGWFSPDFVKVIYNGIEPKRAVDPFPYRKHLGNKKVLLSAGRMTEQKGFDFLIQATSLLRARRDDFAVVILGKGRLEGQLKRMVKHQGLEDTVHFWGFQENIEPYMAGCTVFVLASLFEGMPNVVMEAMALGRPVVATDVNGVRELMVDGETGLIVPPRDPEAIAAAVNRLLDDPQLAREMGIRGRQRVEQHFTVDRMISELEEYFRGLVYAKRQA